MFYKPLPLPIGLSSVKLDDFFSFYNKKLIAESSNGNVRTRTWTFFLQKNIIEIAVRILYKITDLLMLPLHHVSFVC